MADAELDLRERRPVRKLSGQGLRVAGISQQAGRHRSKICREPERNRFGDEPGPNGCCCPDCPWPCRRSTPPPREAAAGPQAADGRSSTVSRPAGRPGRLQAGCVTGRWPSGPAARWPAGHCAATSREGGDLRLCPRAARQGRRPRPPSAGAAEEAAPAPSPEASGQDGPCRPFDRCALRKSMTAGGLANGKERRAWPRKRRGRPDDLPQDARRNVLSMAGRRTRAAAMLRNSGCRAGPRAETVIRALPPPPLAVHQFRARRVRLPSGFGAERPGGDRCGRGGSGRGSEFAARRDLGPGMGTEGVRHRPRTRGGATARPAARRRGGGRARPRASTAARAAACRGTARCRRSQTDP